MDTVEHNRQLAYSINREVWNEGRLELIEQYFTDDFVADYSPRVVRRGHDGVRAMVTGAHQTFDNFTETIRACVADENRVVLHITISGRQVADWGPVPASNRNVSYDEILIMSVRDGKVCHQIGVSDTLLALQQLGAIPDPAGFTRGGVNAGSER